MKLFGIPIKKKQKNPIESPDMSSQLTTQKSNIKPTTDIVDPFNFQETPKILLIDMNEVDKQLLESKGFNCIAGTFGTQVNIPNIELHDECICLSNHDFPPNLHEFNIIIMDLSNSKSIPYDPDEHKPTYVKGQEAIVIRCRYPRTIFDPRPFGGAILGSRLKNFIKNRSILIAFCSSKQEVTYEFARISKRGIETENESTYNTYSFLSELRFPESENVMGKETHVLKTEDIDFIKLLNAHNKEAIYNITFIHPEVYDTKQKSYIKCDKFIPLMVTSDDRIIAYIDYDSQASIFAFPNIRRKGEFLVELLQTVLPAFFPTLFPYTTTFAWLKDKEYQLPNEEIFNSRRIQIEEEYTTNIEKLDKELQENYEKYSWLHNLLTDTGDPLVRTVERYFKFLEFPKVINVDEENPSLKEEDLRVELEKGLLVVEVKGIGGTSTDSDCSQISKIRFRRGKQRDAYDVYALYIVNHQLNLRPQDRTYPPFTEQQIKDAENDTRSLLTTYELFKLYFYIQDGLITKRDARDSILEYGLVVFKPSNAQYIGLPLEIHYGGIVVIISLEKIRVTKETVLIIVEPHNIHRVNITNIQINGKNVEEAVNGEVGIKLDSPISKTAQIWIPNPKV